MKYYILLGIFLLSFVIASASECNDYCNDEGYDSGICRSAEDDFCKTNETMFGFDQCDEGSYERCCCFNEDSSEEGASQLESSPELETGKAYKRMNISIEKEDLPELIFFELLFVILILVIFVAFKQKKPEEYI